MIKFLLTLLGAFLWFIEFLYLLKGILLDITTHQSRMMWTSFVLMLITGIVWTILFKLINRKDSDR